MQAGGTEARLGSKPSPEILKAIRIAIGKGLGREGYRSHEEFAYAIGLPKSTLSRLLRDMIDPRLSTLEKIAHGLGMQTSDLLAQSRTLESQEPLRAKPGRKRGTVLNVKVTIPAGGPPPAWLDDLKADSEGAPRSRTRTKR